MITNESANHIVRLLRKFGDGDFAVMDLGRCSIVMEATSFQMEFLRVADTQEQPDGSLSGNVYLPRE